MGPQTKTGPAWHRSHRHHGLFRGRVGNSPPGPPERLSLRYVRATGCFVGPRPAGRRSGTVLTTYRCSSPPGPPERLSLRSACPTGCPSSPGPWAVARTPTFDCPLTSNLLSRKGQPPWATGHRMSWCIQIPSARYRCIAETRTLKLVHYPSWSRNCRPASVRAGGATERGGSDSVTPDGVGPELAGVADLAGLAGRAGGSYFHGRFHWKPALTTPT